MANMDGSNSKVLHQNQRDPLGQSRSFGEHNVPGACVKWQLLFPFFSASFWQAPLAGLTQTLCVYMHLVIWFDLNINDQIKAFTQLAAIQFLPTFDLFHYWATFVEGRAAVRCKHPQYHKTRQKIEGICQRCLVMDSIYGHLIWLNFPASTAAPLHLCSLHSKFIWSDHPPWFEPPSWQRWLDKWKL